LTKSRGGEAEETLGDYWGRASARKVDEEMRYVNVSMFLRDVPYRNEARTGKGNTWRLGGTEKTIDKPRLI
jgi:hypothetical protein